MAEGEVLGEIWAVAGPGAAGPVDVRVFVRGVANQRYGLPASGEPRQIVPAGVAMSKLIVQNLSAVSIELGNDRGLQYGQGMRIAPNSILSGGAITPGGPGAAVVESYTRAALPAVGNAGRLARLIDYDRALWMEDGGAWRSLTHETFDVKAFGALGIGAGDDGPAFQAAIDQAKARGGIVIVPPAASFYRIATMINCDDIRDGILILGTTVQSTVAPELRWVGAAGSGPMIRLNSSHGVTLKGLRLTYSDAAYNGSLVSADHSAAAIDVARLHVEDCEFAGIGAATGAASLLRLNRTIIAFVRGCHFINAVDGILVGDGNFANVIQIENCDFNTCSTAPIFANATCEAITISGCTFEPRADGTGRAFRQNNALFIYGLTFVNNWCGDVSVNGGGGWVEAHVTSAVFMGNRFSTPGGGAADVCIRVLGGSTAVVIMGSRFEGANNLDFGANVLGVCLAGNTFGGAILNEVNAAVGEYVRIGNDGPVQNTNRAGGTTHGFGLLDASVAASGFSTFIGYLQAMPAAGVTPGFIAILDAAFAPGGVAGGIAVVPSDNGGANSATHLYSGNPRTERVRITNVINLMGKLYPMTDAGALQVAAGIMAGNGVPNNANGANGDFYFNSAGAAGTTIYQRRAGAWVGIV